MINSIRKMMVGRKADNLFLKYKNEVAKNFELWHVIKQLKRLRQLETGAMRERTRLGIGAADLILRYEDSVLSYQEKFGLFAVADAHYKSSLEVRSRESARILNDKREAAFSALSRAGESIEEVHTFFKGMKTANKFHDVFTIKKDIKNVVSAR